MSPFLHLLFLLFVRFTLYLKMVKIHFQVVPLLLCFGLQKTSILGKSYRFGQPTILFQKVDTLWLLKIHIMFCPTRGPKNGISSWTNTSVQRCLYPLFQNQERETERQHSTIFATFTFLVYVSLTNNLASSIQKYEGSLT